jgi:hypothetical protein
MLPTSPGIVPAKNSPTRLALYPRFLIFSLALVLRGIAGALFFGSVDLINSATNSLALLAGGRVDLPYLPTINAFLWFGGVLSATLPVPFPLSLKLGPILFDALLAVLVYDLARRNEPRLALRAGLLYASNPLSILITSFHGQWDAMALFFLLLAFGLLQECRCDGRKNMIFGALFGVGLLIKPIGLPFLLLFPLRRGYRWSMDRSAMLGLTMAVGVAFSLFWTFGYSTVLALARIVSYSAKGVQVFGLPFSPLLSRFHLQEDRLYCTLPAMFVLGYFYQRHKLTAMDAMLLFYLYCLAVVGISPQYLLWPVPLLIITKRLRLAALYTGIATAFLLAYYSSPWASYDVSENLGVFAPLRGLRWLLPPAFLERPEFLPIVHVLGNIVLPVCAMIVGALVLKSGASQLAEEQRPVEKSRWGSQVIRRYAAPSLLVILTILGSRFLVHSSQLPARLRQIWTVLPNNYEFHIESLYPRVVLVRDSVGSGQVNVVILLALFAATWCVCAARASRTAGAMR